MADAKSVCEFALPEPPHGRLEQFIAAGQKVGEWYAPRYVELIKKAGAHNVLSDELTDSFGVYFSKDLFGTANDLRRRGYPEGNVVAFEKAALAAFKDHLGRASVIEGLLAPPAADPTPLAP